MRLPLIRFACLLLAGGLLLALGACADDESPGSSPPADAGTPAIPFRPDGTLAFVRGDDTLSTIAIEVAATDSARERGLMGRPSLPEESGMLFTFEREEERGFWMGDTPLSLDLFFANADSQIVSITKYARPYSPESIPSGAPARFVVEVPAGFADSEGIVEGDRVTWRRE